MPELATPKEDPSMLRKAEDGAPIASPDKKTKSAPCEIDSSLQERKDAGSLTTVCVNKDKKGSDEVVFKLKIKGG